MSARPPPRRSAGAHSNEPLQGGADVDEGIEGLFGFAVALGLPGAARVAAPEAGDDAFGGQLAEVIGAEAAWEVDCAGTGLSEARARVNHVLHRVHAHDEGREPALGSECRVARPELDDSSRADEPIS